MNRAAILASLSVLHLASVAPAAEPKAARPVTALLGAIREEVALVEGRLAGARARTVLGYRFVTGRIGDREVVVARTGVGKVNAAVTAVLLIEHFRPGEVIFTGIAGALHADLRPGDIVIAAKTVQHDLGRVGPDGMRSYPVRNPVGGAHNPLFIPADTRLLAVAKASAEHIELEGVRAGTDPPPPAVRTGVVATGDVFVASAAKKAEIRARLGADAVEMEGAAVAQVCWQLGVPCIVIRSISDVADHKAALDLPRFRKAAARNSAALVCEMARRLGAGQPADAAPPTTHD